MCCVILFIGVLCIISYRQGINRKIVECMADNFVVLFVLTHNRPNTRFITPTRANADPPDPTLFQENCFNCFKTLFPGFRVKPASGLTVIHRKPYTFQTFVSLETHFNSGTKLQAKTPRKPPANGRRKGRKETRK